MPAATTHVEMAKDVLRTSSTISKMVTNQQMFYLGSQGPDLLFFNRASILPGSTKKYGNLMHEEKVYDVISYFERYTKTNEDLKSYFLGYLCHYCLDSTVHPLVYAVSHKKGLETGIDEGEIHVALESELDVWILSQRGRTIDSYDVYQYLKISEQETIALAEMYHNMLMDVFHISVSEKHLQRAIKDVSLYTYVLSPKKWKYDLFYLLENVVLKGSHAITAMMLNQTPIEDIVNLNHKTYTMPWNSKIKIQDSFPELYGKAVLKAHHLLVEHQSSDFSLDFCGK